MSTPDATLVMRLFRRTAPRLAPAFLPLRPFPPPLRPARGHSSRRPSRPSAKLQVEVLTLCKRSGKDLVFEPTIAELSKRMSPVLSVSSRWVKPPHAARAVSDLAARAPVFLLDERGDAPKHSRHFAELLYDALQNGGSRAAFVIGDADGLPPDVRDVVKDNQQVRLLSLGPLTFTHKMVRLFLYEQLYRATEIRANTRYHK